MLAYVFWHRPQPGAEPAEYEQAQREFHESLESPSACFRIAELPFHDRGPAYEDWYLVEGWQGLGELNATAVDPTHLSHHNRAAAMAFEGWGAIYSLLRGADEIPGGVEWLEKPRGEPSEGFVASLPHSAVWRRQLVLGPAPEFCCSSSQSNSRRHI